MSNLMVLQNYFKASVRNMGRNKLFSTINLMGLAISMSLSLMLIAFIIELKSYDTFHENYDRLYRIKSTVHTEHFSSDYASTSVLAAKNIKEQVTGIKYLVMLRNNFTSDVKANDKIVPLEGLWADESFFNVFTFELITGDRNTALKELNSVVLTETSARKLFNSTDVTGQMVTIDTIQYTISAVMKDPPQNSHFKFDMLGSFITIDQKQITSQNKSWMEWDFIWQNYLYAVLDESTSLEAIEQQLASISEAGNKTLEHGSITLSLQSISSIMLSSDMSNQVGVTFSLHTVNMMSLLAFVVILSACFNYSNLSIARALRRMKEVGVRKVVGANRNQIFQQLLVESIVFSLIALVFAFLIFLLLRPELLKVGPNITKLVTLRPNITAYMAFLLFAIGVGVLAGLLPAFFFSKINTVAILKDTSSVKLFGYINLRKALVVFQYALSIGFIVAVSLSNRQYQYAIAYDLGLTTENILNVELQGNKPELTMQAFAQSHEVKQIARSIYIPATGTEWSGNVRYKKSADSTILYYNYVDENYLSLHNLKLLAGKNFRPTSSNDVDEAGVIINEKLVSWMELKQPEDAIGEQVRLDGKNLTIIGVVKDFHYSRINSPVRAFALRYYGNVSPEWGGFVNLKVESNDLPGLMSSLEAVWKTIDPVHPLQAKFFDEKIQEGYNGLSQMAKMIGFMALLAISIASLGLLGMVIFTTETRLREISIRKVLGATDGSLFYMMSKGFFSLLLISAFIAIPAALVLFDKVVFANIAYRAPIDFIGLFASVLIVMGIALLAISSQTWRVAKTNPAGALKKE